MKIRTIQCTPDITYNQYVDQYRNFTKDIFKYIITPMSIEMNNIFHLRKKAWELKNTRHKQVGSLDMSKIYAYKTSAEIFKKKTWKPQGKSHGVVIMVDFSSSMANTYLSCIINAAAIVIFCKKNNIPCRVATFTTKSLAHSTPKTNNNVGMNTKELFGVTENFRSSLIFSDTMSVNTIMTNFFTLVLCITGSSIAKSFPKSFKHKTDIITGIGNVERISMDATPLSMGMWCGIDLCMKLKEDVQQVTLLTISDGEGNQQFTSGTFNCPYNSETYNTKHMNMFCGAYKLKKDDNQIASVLEPIMMNVIANDLGINSIHINICSPSSVALSFPIAYLEVDRNYTTSISSKMNDKGYCVEHNLMGFNKTVFIKQEILDNMVKNNIIGYVSPDSNRKIVLAEKEEKLSSYMDNMNGVKKVLKKAGSDMNAVKEISRVVVEEICKWYR